MDLDRLRELFSYDSVSGLLTRRVTRNVRNAKAGDVVGTVDSGGYLQVRVDGKLVFVHQIAFLMYHEWLPEEIDHHNRKRQDNWVSNLRPATRVQNNGNRSMNSNNTSGYKGVTRQGKNRWRAQITLGGQVTYLGCFASPEAAYDRYKVAAIAHFGEDYAAL